MGSNSRDILGLLSLVEVGVLRVLTIFVSTHMDFGRFNGRLVGVLPIRRNLVCVLGGLYGFVRSRSVHDVRYKPRDLVRGNLRNCVTIVAFFNYGAVGRA